MNPNRRRHRRTRRIARGRDLLARDTLRRLGQEPPVQLLVSVAGLDYEGKVRQVSALFDQLESRGIWREGVVLKRRDGTTAAVFYKRRPVLDDVYRSLLTERIHFLQITLRPDPPPSEYSPPHGAGWSHRSRP